LNHYKPNYPVMKKIFKITYAAFIILMIPFSLVQGQDKKSEQKIKIIVDDGSGTKVVIDTVFKDGSGPDSLVTKDGTVIFMKHPGDEKGMRHHSGREHFYVTYSANGKEDGNQFKEVTVISSDSVNRKTEGDSVNVVYYSNSGTNERRGSERYKVVTRGSKERGDKGEIIYINKSKTPGKEIEYSYTVSDSDNDNDSTMEKTKYVIAKDGMVVTVEGNDETKAKELVKEIEAKLGVKSEGTEKKESVKVESKKTIKK
jgi:hypothetical protein